MKIAIVGEAWGKEEAAQGLPFVGASGKLLNGLLRAAGIDRSQCLVTNVFNLQPARNDIKTLCGPKAQAIPGTSRIAPGKYVLIDYKPELDRLYKELTDYKPVLIIALGATAAWALLNTVGIKKIRGTTYESPYGKVLPTYHPAAVLREWGLRPILYKDLQKARREAEFPEVRRPRRAIWMEPTLEDLHHFEETYITPSAELSIDIETKRDHITCIGFAPYIDAALVVPFYDPRTPDGNYWPSHEAERHAWDWVRRVCSLRKRIIFQNGVYDMTFLLRQYGIPVPYVADDTMLAHHAMQPELEKGLGFLGSIYTDEAAWKFMRHTDTIKRED